MPRSVIDDRPKAFRLLHSQIRCPLCHDARRQYNRQVYPLCPMLSPRLALDKGPERIFLDLDDPGDLSQAPPLLIEAPPPAQTARAGSLDEARGLGSDVSPEARSSSLVL